MNAATDANICGFTQDTVSYLHSTRPALDHKCIIFHSIVPSEVSYLEGSQVRVVEGLRPVRVLVVEERDGPCPRVLHILNQLLKHTRGWKSPITRSHVNEMCGINLTIRSHVGDLTPLDHMWVRCLTLRSHVGEMSHHEITCGGDLSPRDHMWVRILAIISHVGKISHNEVTCG